MFAAVALVTAGAAACSGDDDEATADTTEQQPDDGDTTMADGSEDATMPASSAEACDAEQITAMVQSGQDEGTLEGMTDDPVGTAASNNPVLTTLTQAVTAANLVDSLNGQQDITVLAPANPAFEAVPADALQALLADSAQLTAVLTHHVIAGRLTPEQLAGTHTTLNNDEVTIEGEAEMFTIAGEGTVTSTEATVICGNVQTANATVYIIDQVLAPPAA